MRIVADSVRVTVPATAGNLGPGFDSLGMALGVADTVEVRAVATTGVEIQVDGHGADSLARDESHLIVQAIRATLDALGASQTGLEIRATNRIPHGRGLGSSAAAVVAGIAAARALVAEPEVLDKEGMLRIATEFEGHPDNAAPAIWGGATVAWLDDSGAHARPLTVDPTLESLVLIPASTLPTKQARAVLPQLVPHSDATFNVGRAALLVHALAGDLDVLMQATEDRLHQNYRAQVLGPATAMLGHVRRAGHAAVISGAGPSVLVLGRGLGELATSGLDGVGGESWTAIHTAAPVAGVAAERL